MEQSETTQLTTDHLTILKSINFKVLMQLVSDAESGYVLFLPRAARVLTFVYMLSMLVDTFKILEFEGPHVQSLLLLFF